MGTHLFEDSGATSTEPAVIARDGAPGLAARVPEPPAERSPACRDRRAAHPPVPGVDRRASRRGVRLDRSVSPGARRRRRPVRPLTHGRPSSRGALGGGEGARVQHRRAVARRADRPCAGGRPHRRFGVARPHASRYLRCTQVGTFRCSNGYLPVRNVEKCKAIHTVCVHATLAAMRGTVVITVVYTVETRFASLFGTNPGLGLVPRVGADYQRPNTANASNHPIPWWSVPTGTPKRWSASRERPLRHSAADGGSGEERSRFSAACGTRTRRPIRMEGISPRRTAS